MAPETAGNTTRIAAAVTGECPLATTELAVALADATGFALLNGADDGSASSADGADSARSVIMAGTRPPGAGRNRIGAATHVLHLGHLPADQQSPQVYTIDPALPVGLQMVLALDALGPAALDAELRRRVSRLLADAETGQLPDIVTAGSPVLRRGCQRWRGQLPDADLQRLIAVMRDCMHAAPGVGLAAPQLGLNLRLAVLQDSNPVPEPVRSARNRHGLDFLVVLNPEYRAVTKQVSRFYEGCLSVPGWQAVVPRHETVALTYLDRNLVPQTDELSGWAARIAQHETDHLNGRLYVDLAETRSIASAAEYRTWWDQPTIAAAAAGLGF